MRSSWSLFFIVGGSVVFKECTGTENKVPETVEETLHLEMEQCLAAQDNSTGNSSHCATLWDGSMCWKGGAPGQVVTQPCHNNEPINSKVSMATKFCTSEGNWSSTDLSQCTDYLDSNDVDAQTDFVLLRRWIPLIKTISQVGYSISLGTLIVAFILLACMKKLRCPRNTLLLHLFFSFIMRAFVTLLQDILLVKGVGLAKDVVVDENGLVAFLPDRTNWECKALVSFWNYCLIANYTWIFMEGLYLHNLIFLALFTDSTSITLYIIVGWGLPIFFLVPWILLRITYEDTKCWNTHEDSNIYLLLRVPVIICVILSFVLFMNISRVLLLKMQSIVYLERRKLRYRRWAKSTLVLVPLFGVHYVIFVWLIHEIKVSTTMMIVYLFVDQLFASFQGFLVALLYCLMNSEVRAEVVRKWRSYKYNKQHCKRGSAQSLPPGLHSVLTLSRMYNGVGSHGDSLSSGSGITPPCGQIEFNSLDIPTVSKHLNEQKAETANWKSDKRPSLTQEIILSHCHCNSDSVCFNSTCRQDELVEKAKRPCHLSYDGIDNSEATTNEFAQQREVINSSYQRRRSADSNAPNSFQVQSYSMGQNGYANAHDDFCSSSKYMVNLGASRST